MKAFWYLTIIIRIYWELTSRSKGFTGSNVIYKIYDLNKQMIFTETAN